ncbi:MAG: transglycosylase SLT domain-containing protein, partial [Pseudolabrys sp.]
MAVHPATASAPQVTGAIRQAAQSTGISFEYLLTTAKIESNFNPTAQASTSSAKGLYQFIDQTWLGTMKQDALAKADTAWRPGHGHTHRTASTIINAAPGNTGAAFL